MSTWQSAAFSARASTRGRTPTGMAAASNPKFTPGGTNYSQNRVSTAAPTYTGNPFTGVAGDTGGGYQDPGAYSSSSSGGGGGGGSAAAAPFLNPTHGFLLGLQGQQNTVNSDVRSIDTGAQLQMLSQQRLGIASQRLGLQNQLNLGQSASSGAFTGGGNRIQQQQYGLQQSDIANQSAQSYDRWAQQLGSLEDDTAYQRSMLSYMEGQ